MHYSFVVNVSLPFYGGSGVVDYLINPESGTIPVKLNSVDVGLADYTRITEYDNQFRFHRMQVICSLFDESAINLVKSIPFVVEPVLYDHSDELEFVLLK